MTVVPKDPIDQVQFYESHVGPWGVSAASIGLSSQSVSALAAATAAARAAFNAQRAAINAARAATENFHEKVRLMHAAPGAGADMIRQIKLHAANKNDPAVYTLAQIPAPASPSTMPPPGTPSNFKVGLGAAGLLTISWACKNPAGSKGTVYEVSRRVEGLEEDGGDGGGDGGGGGFVYVGCTGVKSFTDDTFPAGATGVTYQITAIRSTARGQPARFTVRLGGMNANAVRLVA